MQLNQAVLGHAREYMRTSWHLIGVGYYGSVVRLLCSISTVGDPRIPNKGSHKAQVTVHRYYGKLYVHEQILALP
jgi:hypothetical protein